MRVIERDQSIEVGSDAPGEFGRIRAKRPAVPADLVAARTCYDHLAGKLGVGIFDALVAHQAIVPPGDAPPGRAGARQPIELGPAAVEVFGRLDLDLVALRQGRRGLAFACLDWTERRPHLAGALGAAICDRLVADGWVRRRPTTRAVTPTPSGKERLRELFGISFSD